MIAAEHQRLHEFVKAVAPADKRFLRRLFREHRDIAVAALSDEFLLETLPPADRWWLHLEE